MSHHINKKDFLTKLIDLNQFAKTCFTQIIRLKIFCTRTRRQKKTCHNILF